MAEKRPRAGEEYLHIQEEEVEVKRHKASSSSSSYNQILSFLEEDEEEPNQDFSSLITSLQQEISSEPSSNSESSSESEPNNNFDHPTPSNSFHLSSAEDEDDKERVIRHLLEASDDELGIPNDDVEEFQVGEEFFGTEINGERGFEFSLCDDFWELEDNTANYYTLSESDLFL